MIRATFPGEITDRIIDFLHDSQEALKVCSLTCRAWRPASHFHLLHTIELQNGTQASEVLALIEKRADIAQYVRCLDISEMRAAWVQWAEALPVLLQHLQNVRSLRVSDRPPPGFLRFDWPVLAQLSSVEHITVSNPSLRDEDRGVERLALFLNQFPRLRSLDINIIGVRSEATPGALALIPPPTFQLSVLQYPGGVRDFFTMEWLLPATTGLHRLRTDYDRKCVNYTMQVVRTAAQTLQRFKVERMWRTETAALTLLENTINICPSLRTLELEGFVLTAQPSRSPPVYGVFLLQLFATLAVNCLEAIKISFVSAHSSHVPTSVGKVPWTEIGECLLGGAYPKLRTFSVTLKSSAGADANFEAEIRSQMSRLCAVDKFVFRLLVE